MDFPPSQFSMQRPIDQASKAAGSIFGFKVASSFETRARALLLRMRSNAPSCRPDPHGEERGDAARLRTMLRIALRSAMGLLWATCRLRPLVHADAAGLDRRRPIWRSRLHEFGEIFRVVGAATNWSAGFPAFAHRRVLIASTVAG